MKYHVGDTLGSFLLINKDGVKWTAKCTCGNIWSTRLIRLKGRTNCPKCSPPRSYKQRQPGETINSHTLLERLPSRKWKTQCKCGATRICSPADLKRYDTCKACYDPEKVAGQLRLPPKEKETNYRIRYYKKHAKERNYDWELTKFQTQTLLQSICNYCGSENAQGIDRVDNSQGYTISNCVSCCNFCNHAKKNYPKEEFLNHIKRIYEYQFRDYPEREYSQAAGNMEPPRG